MFGSKTKKNHENDHGNELGNILKPEERVDLTLLISNITELMRKQITDNFDASISSSHPPNQALNITDKNPNIDAARKEGSETAEEKAARELQEQRERELSAPKMLELKKDYLEFFDSWRESVLSRVGNAINNSKQVTEEQKDKASASATPQTGDTSKPQVIGNCYPCAFIDLHGLTISRVKYEYRRGRCSTDQALSTNLNVVVFPFAR